MCGKNFAAQAESFLKMSLRKNKREIERLIAAFKSEAAKFHDITFSTYSIRNDIPPENRRFRTPNHAIMLWQYYWKIKSDDDAKRLAENLKKSDLQWGMRGAQLSESCSFVLMTRKLMGCFQLTDILTGITTKLVRLQNLSWSG
jgi:hypothetical protein